MRPLDPLMVILGCYAILSWRKLAIVEELQPVIVAEAVAV
jgi:hypothetical protein